MSLYIEKMELPDKHKDLYGYKQDYVDCRIWNDGTVQILYGAYASDSPYKAVPVPEHGKLVDVADVKELFEKHFGDDQIAFQLIDSVPVIIPPKSKEQQDLEDLVERLNREGIAP